MTSRISPPRNSAPPRPQKTFANPGGSGGEITNQGKRPKLDIDPKKKKPRDDEFAPGSDVKLGDGGKGPKIPPPPPPPAPGSDVKINDQEPLPRLLIPKKG